MLLLRFKNVFHISHLHFDPQNESFLKKYESAPSGPYNLPLKFIYSKQKPTLFNKIFLDRQLARRFQNVIEYVGVCSQNSPQQNRDAFPNIQQTLLTKISSFIKSRPQNIVVHECNVGRAFFLQEKQMYGVFFHRRLNLPRNCYSEQFVQKTRQLKYRVKGKLNRMEDMRDYEKAKQTYEDQGFSRFYKDTFQGFQNSEYITRSLVKVIVDLKIEIKVPQFSESIRLGYQGPSEHILQYQSVKVPYQEEQYAITDIDFFLQGNYHFLKERN